MEFKIFEMPEVRLPFSFHSSYDVYERMKGYGKADRELFLILFLDSKNKALKIETHSIGTIDSCAVYPREVIKSAIVNNSTSLIFIHHHPSGDCIPSFGDNQITKRLVYCASLFSIKVLDHVIIGKDSYYSFGDEGLIEDYEREFNLFDKNIN